MNHNKLENSMESLTHQIITLHRDSIPQWKEHGVHHEQQGFLQIVEANHAFNFQLWQTEDCARRDDLGHEYVYRAKRDIDQYNQQRNNCMEAMDSWLYDQLQPANPADCPVHSETPGMMIDRLSILALKAYHMGLQAHRQQVEEAHRQTCSNALHVIEQQQKQLQGCLQSLLMGLVNKTRTFQVYHQFKMYNDPKLRELS